MALSGATAARILVVFCLTLLSGVDSYKGVWKRNLNDRVVYHCEVSFKGSAKTGHREKLWVGTYDTEILAVLACDVANYYTDRLSDIVNPINLEQGMLACKCPPRSSYTILTTWDQRRQFIKNQANAVVRAVQTDFRYGPEDVVLMQSELIAERVVVYFSARPRGPFMIHQVMTFMAWFLDPSNEQQILQVHNDQNSEEARRDAVLRLYTDHGVVAPGSPDVDLDNVAAHMQTLIEARPRGRASNSIMRLLLLFGSALSAIFSLGASEEEKKVYAKLQALRKEYLGDMVEVHRLLTARFNQANLPSNQRVKEYISAIDRTIPYLKVPQHPLPKDFNMDKVDAVKECIVKILEPFTRMRQDGHCVTPAVGVISEKSAERNPEEEAQFKFKAKFQALKTEYLVDLAALHGLLTFRNQHPQPPEQLHKHYYYMHAVDRIITTLQGPPEECDNMAKVDAWEKEILHIMETFKAEFQSGIVRDSSAVPDSASAVG